MRTFTRHLSLVASIALLSSGVAVSQPVKLPPRPTPGPAKPFVFPPITVDTLANGLRYAVVENHELPLVTVRVAFAGVGPLGMTFLDPAGKEGAWGVLLSSLREGTASRSATQISDEIADLGVDFFTTTAAAFTPPWFRSPKSTWMPSLQLLGDMMMNPTISSDAFAKVQAVAATQVERLTPVSLANRAVFTALYGPTSPYTHFATTASIRGLTRDDVIAIQREYLNPQNTLMVIAGDVTLAEARKAMSETFGKWPRSGKAYTPIVPPAPAQRAPTTIYLKDSPGQAQQIVAAAQILPGRDHADAAAIEALSSVLGDYTVSSGSRVYRAFRTERGLSYSPRVELITRPIPETVPMIGTFAVPVATVDTAIMVWMQVARDIRDSKPITESELEFSKNNLIGRLPADMERVDAMALTVLGMLNDRLPGNYLNDWVRRINSLTIPQVQAAANQYLDPDHMAIIVVGDRAKIEAALRATGIPVVIVDR